MNDDVNVHNFIIVPLHRCPEFEVQSTLKNQALMQNIGPYANAQSFMKLTSGLPSFFQSPS